MRFNSIRKELISRYILFSCEGPDEGVVIEKLYESDALVIPKPHIVDDPMTFKPFTRLRKSRDIEQRFFRESYEGNGASGLLIARIVKAIRQYDRCRSQRNDEFSLGMLLA